MTEGRDLKLQSAILMALLLRLLQRLYSCDCYEGLYAVKSFNGLEEILGRFFAKIRPIATQNGYAWYKLKPIDRCLSQGAYR